MLFCSCFFFFKQKTAYEMRISDWSSDVCSSDLAVGKNRGKPEIWLDWEGFVEHAEMLEQKAVALAAAFETDDSSGIQAAFGDMGKNGCGSCHDDFRGPKVE